jgi:spermidine synthase
MKRKHIILILFFFTGALALTYETLWTRMLGLVFGNSTYAISTVFAAFMAGLALGSWFFGKKADRTGFKKNRLLKLYGFLMAGLGVYAFFSPVFFEIIKFINVNSPFDRYALFSSQGADIYYLSLAASLVSFSISFIVLLIPSALIGGTLPVIAKWFSEDEDSDYKKIGKDVAILYSIETFGAVIGTFLCGYFLIRWFGLNEIIYSAAFLNIAIGVFALWLGKSGKDKNVNLKKVEEKQKSTKIKVSFLGKAERKIILIAIAISGFTALSYEVLLTRTLSLILGSSTYALTSILCSFLMGISLGAMIYAFYVRKKPLKEYFAAFGFTQGSIGILVLILIPIFQVMPFFFIELFKYFGGDFFTVQFIQFIIAVLSIMLPAIFFGISFPLAIDAYKKENIASSVGNVYFANTLGAVFGTLLTGFFLIKWLGVQKAIAAMAFLNIALGIFLINFKCQLLQKTRIITSAVPLLLLLTYLFFIPPWNKNISSSGIYQYVQDYLKESSFFPEQEKEVWKNRMEIKEMLFYEEGANFTVAVQRHNGITSLSIDGKTDASSNFQGDMVTQLFSAHLPLLFHPEPKDALVVGLASGVSLGGVAKWKNLKSIDCIEIEPATIKSLRYFEKWNNKPLEDERVNLIIDDARNYLLATKKSYDIIISEPSNPWILGCSPLFTKEYYELVKAKLNKGGLFCGWMQIYAMTPKDYMMIMKTINSVFENVTIWHASGGDTLVLASMEKPMVDYKKFKDRFNYVKEDLKKIHFNDALSVLNQFVMSEKTITHLSEGLEINSDNYPHIEFSAARNMYNHNVAHETENMLSDNAEAPLKYLRGFDEHFNLIKKYLSDGNHRLAEKIFDFDFSGKNSAKGYDLQGLFYLSKQDYYRADKMFEKAISLNPNFIEPYVNCGEVHLQQKDYKKALARAERALNIKTQYPPALNLKGSIYVKMGKFPEALAEFKKAQKSDSSFVLPYINSARVYLDYMNIPPAAFFVLQEALVENPEDARLYYLLGRTFLKLGNFKQGSEMLFRAVHFEPEYKDSALQLLSDYKAQKKK